MADKGRLLIDGTVKSRTVVSARDSPHYNFSVKFNTSVCSQNTCSFLDRRNGCMKFCLSCSSNSSDKSCCYPWVVCRDKLLNQQCIVRSGLLPDDKSSSCLNMNIIDYVMLHSALVACRSRRVPLICGMRLQLDELGSEGFEFC